MLPLTYSAWREVISTLHWLYPCWDLLQVLSEARQPIVLGRGGRDARPEQNAAHTNLCVQDRTGRWQVSLLLHKYMMWFIKQLAEVLNCYALITMPNYSTMPR